MKPSLPSSPQQEPMSSDQSESEGEFNLTIVTVSLYRQDRSRNPDLGAWRKKA